MLDGEVRLLQDALQQVLKVLPQMSGGCIIEKRPDGSLTASSLRSATGRSALSALCLVRLFEAGQPTVTRQARQGRAVALHADEQNVDPLDQTAQLLIEPRLDVV
jgi:hypothetical protein